MKRMCAQTRLQFILSSKRALWNRVKTHFDSKENIPSTTDRGGSNPPRCTMQDSEVNTLPTELFQPPAVFETEQHRASSWTTPSRALFQRCQHLGFQQAYMWMAWRKKRRVKTRTDCLKNIIIIIINLIYIAQFDTNSILTALYSQSEGNVTVREVSLSPTPSPLPLSLCACCTLLLVRIEERGEREGSVTVPKVSLSPAP